MAIMKISGQPSRWRYLAELPFIPVVNDWLELLASLLAQPLMFLSSLYIIAEVVTPGLTAWSTSLDVVTKDVMSLAPEIILPGCFQQAQQAQRDGKLRKAGMLFGLCGLFGLLTLVTFASFLWHFTGDIANFVLFVRCASGVGYTVILKIDKQQQRAVAEHSAQAVSFAQLAEDLAAQLQDQVKEQLSALRSELRNEVTSQAREVRTEMARLRTVQADALRGEAERLRVAQEMSVSQLEQALMQQIQPALTDFTASIEEQLATMHTMITEIPAQPKALAQVSTVRTAQTEPALPAVSIAPLAAQDTDARQRVHEYVKAYQQEHNGKAPTLELVMVNCEVAKNTAVKYRREVQ